MIDLLGERGRGDIKVFGGGGGVIVENEIRELEEYGVSRIYTPDDGRKIGLDGMISDMIDRVLADKGGNQGRKKWLNSKNDVNQLIKGIKGGDYCNCSSSHCI